MKCPCLCRSDFLSAPEDGVMTHAAGRKLHVSVQLEPAPLLLQSLGFFLFFLSQSDYYLAAGQAQITWLDPFFFLLPCLALGCQQVCHDFAHDLLLAECGQWAGLLMDCFFWFIFERRLQKVWWVCQRRTSDALFLRYSVFSALMHMFDVHMQNRWGEWKRLCAGSHLCLCLSLFNNISSFCILMTISGL